MTQLVDAEARRRIATEFGTTFFVESAAGTGKTTALVRRIVGLISAGVASLDRIVAVTFTEKAAGETKLHLRSEIEKARTGARSDERARLDAALEHLELARIGTIHAFCTDLLHERPVEAAIDPLFEVAAEEEAQALADEAFDEWFEGTLANPPEGVRRLLRRRSERVLPREQLRSAVNSMRDHRDFPAPWRRDPFDRDNRIDALVSDLAALGSIAQDSSWPEDSLAGNLAEIGRFIATATRLETISARDYDGLEAELRSLARSGNWRASGARKTSFGGLTREEVRERRDRVKANLDAFVAASDADLAPLLHGALQTPIAAYERLKTRAGRLDFLDLLIRTRDLVRDDATVRHELQRRYTHFFIDEFQDTDPLQAEILLLLAADDPSVVEWRSAQPVPGKLFLVGDPKQSIYRFRRADIALYEEVKEQLLRTGAELLHLTASFRARPSIQTFINEAFSRAMSGGTERGQASYVPLENVRPETKDQPTLIALPVPRPYGDYGRITKRAMDESFPTTVAAFISWLINDSGWTVEENGVPTPICPRHIAILFRRFRNFGSDITRGYVRALEARRIAHVLVGGRSFHECEEVIALCNALTAIEWPDDELSVFATLRGPFFAFTDEALLLFRHEIGAGGAIKTRRLHPMRPVEPDTVPPAATEVPDALGLLRTLHLGRNRRPVAQTITMLLEAARTQAGVALWPSGEQALANIQRLIDMARQFERGASSFRAFINKLERDAERGDADEAPIVEEGTEGVRLMTVHKAKGLQFPLVVLADPTCSAARDTPSRHVNSVRQLWVEPLCGSAPSELLEAAAAELQREQDEAVRVAYVAATRARDFLVAPVCGDQKIDGWLSVLDPVLYPPLATRSISTAAPGCPEFGADSVLDRGEGKMPEGGPVRPGMHHPVRGGPAVIWWDPARLTLEVPEPVPVRHQQILEAGSAGAAASEAHYAAWVEDGEVLRAGASVPSITVKTVTAIAQAGPLLISDEKARGDAALLASPPNVEIEITARPEAKRPGGRRFGALVHAILAAVDLRASQAEIQSVVALQRRMFDATQEEIGAAIETVTAALHHPVMRRAAAAGKKDVRRETPVILRFEDGSLAEGVVDLAFREAGPNFSGWTVVDFKTDQEFSGESARYARQVQLYVEAVRTATEMPARGLVLVI